MKKIVLALIMGTTALQAYATDLFLGGKPASFEKNAPLPSDATVGGYAIYQGDGSWRIDNVSSAMSSTLGNAESINRGTVVMIQREPNENWFATMSVTVNLSNAGSNQYVTGSPCAGTHLVSNNLGKGLDDNCLTIDADSYQTGTRLATYFVVRVTQNKSSGRTYVIRLTLSAELLGFRQTSPSDWTAESVKQAPNRKEFLVRIRKWGEALQQASERALDFSKPQDVFVSIPSYRTLMPVPAGLTLDKYSQEFLSAVESTRYKPGYRAIAYSASTTQRTRWQNQTDMDSQEVADKLAIEGCEKGRVAAAEPCKLYDLGPTPASDKGTGN